jgi:hypothetical protein
MNLNDINKILFKLKMKVFIKKLIFFMVFYSYIEINLSKIVIVFKFFFFINIMKAELK